MKNFLFLKKLLFMLLLFAALPLLAQPQTDSDTVWLNEYYPNTINNVKFTPDGKYVAYGAYHGAALLDAENGAEIRRFINGKDCIVDISSDGKFIAIGDGSSKGYASLWNIETGELVKEFKNTNDLMTRGVHSLIFSPDMNYLIVNYNASTDITNMNYIIIYNINTGAIVKIISAPDANQIAYSPTGQYFAIGYSKYKSGENYSNKIGLYEHETWNYKGSFDGHESIVTGLNFSPDGTLFASGGWDDYIRIWDVATLEQVNKIKQDTLGGIVYDVEFYYNNHILSSGGNSIRYGIYFWNISSSNYNYLHYWNIWSKEFHLSNDKNYIAVANSSNVAKLKINLTDVDNKINEVENYNIYPNPVNNIAVLKLSILKANYYIIEIYDDTGIKMKSIYEGYLSSGQNEIKLDLSNVKSGAYICSIKSKSYNKTIKLIVMR